MHFKPSQCHQRAPTKVTNGSSITFLLLPYFDVICDLLLNRRTATWDLFIGESLLTSLLTFCSLAYDLPNRSSGRIYELNAKVERAD